MLFISSVYSYLPSRDFQQNGKSCYFFFSFILFLTGLPVVFETLRNKIRNMQKNIKKSSMQIAKINYAYLYLMHKYYLLFFHIVDKIA